MKTCKNITTADLYALTMSRNAKKLSELKDKIACVDAWAQMERVDADGTVHSITSIKSDGGFYATNSATFAQRFRECLEFLESAGMNDTGFDIQVLSKVGKNGRAYSTCELVLG